MSILRRHPRLGRHQCEHLLDGSGRPAAAFDDLAGLLRAARGPQQPGELPGEPAALAAFRAAASDRRPPRDVVTTAGPDATEENGSLPHPTTRRLLAVKALAAGALTMTVGGVAFAATTGVPSFPGGEHRTAATATGSPAVRPTGTSADRTAGRPATTTRTDDGGRPTASGRPTALRPGLDERAALLVGCARWTRIHDSSKAGDTGEGGPELADLVRAAGGADRTQAYCAELVDELCPDTRPGARGASPTAVPGAVPGCPKVGPSPRPTGTPSATPARPTGAPGPTTTRPRPEPSGSGSGAQSARPKPPKTAPTGGRP